MNGLWLGRSRDFCAMKFSKQLPVLILTLKYFPTWSLAELD